MGRRRRALGRALLALPVAALGVWWAGPYEPAKLSAGFDPARFGGDVSGYFARAEAAFDDVTPGTGKRVIWASEPGRKTPVSIVYLHGFSATSEEIRPVPDRIAAGLGANLVYTRLTGHGRPGAALAQATVADWMADTAEALAAARETGERVVVIATSTGATLAVAAAADPGMRRDVAAMILISPNFGMKNRLAPLLTWPAARYWLPLLAGRERVVTPRSPAQERFWTTRYPSVAVMPLAALVRAADRLDLSRAPMPALFWFAPEDKVVRAEITARKAAQWGGPATVRTVRMGPGDDPYAHVVAGDAMSPGQTDLAVSEMTAWLRGVLGPGR